jgi:hypothetical protein
VTAHQFYDHNPLVAGSGRVQAIQRVRGTLNGAVKAEGKRRGGEIVVDRFRHTYHRNAVFVKLLGDGERAIPADTDQTRDIQLFCGVFHAREEFGIDFYAVGDTHSRGKPTLVC